MGKRKKGLLDYAIQFLGLVFGFAKWLLLGLWHLLFSIALFMLSLLKKGGVSYKKMEQEKRRSKTPASFSGFQLVDAALGAPADFESKLYSGKSLIGLILGSRGSGKSALGMRIAENIKAELGIDVCAMGFDESSLPNWISSVQSPAEVKNHSFLLVDEGGITFSSRESMSDANKLLSELLLISRHKDISVLFITQNSSNIEINTLRQVDYLLLKSPSLLQLDFERKKIKDIYDKAQGGFEKYREIPGLLFIYSDSFSGFACNALPSFWSEGLSKSFSNASEQDQKKDPLAP